MHHGFGFMIALFTLFFVGAAIDIWRVSSHSVNSKLNGISTYTQYFKINGAIEASKVFLALVFLLYWLFHQSDFEALVALLWPGGSVPRWLQGVIVLNPAIAGGFGLGFDVIEDLALTYLKKKFPNSFPADVFPTYQSAVVKEIDSPTVKP